MEQAENESRTSEKNDERTVRCERCNELNKEDKRKVKTDQQMNTSVLLQKSLALSLVKVSREIGYNTAKEILTIVQDGNFCISDFKKNYPTIEECENELTRVIGKCLK